MFNMNTVLRFNVTSFIENTCYFHFIMSHVSSRRGAFQSHFVKVQCKNNTSHSPCDDATIFFLSSTEASLLHRDGYLLYKEPLNIRK